MREAVGWVSRQTEHVTVELTRRLYGGAEVAICARVRLEDAKGEAGWGLGLVVRVGGGRVLVWEREEGGGGERDDEAGL